MRWLLQELLDLAASTGQAPDSETGGLKRHPDGGIVSAVADAASAFVSSTSEAASEFANELGSTVAATVVEVCIAPLLNMMAVSAPAILMKLTPVWVSSDVIGVYHFS